MTSISSNLPSILPLRLKHKATEISESSPNRLAIHTKVDTILLSTASQQVSDTRIELSKKKCEISSRNPTLLLPSHPSVDLYHAPRDFVNLDSARQRQIEALHSKQEVSSQSGKSYEGNRFGKVTADLNFQHLLRRGITLLPPECLPDPRGFISRPRPRQSDSCPPVHILSSKASIHDPFLIHAMEVQETCQIVFGGRTIKLVPNSELMIGQHSWIASIAPNEPPIIQNVRNDQIIVKTYREISIRTRNHPKYQIRPNAAQVAMNQ